MPPASEWRDQIVAFETDPTAIAPRTYQGIPLAASPRASLAPLDRSLVRRRSTSTFSAGMPSKRVLSRLLRLAHGICADRARGPVPSAGGMQSLELYLVTFEQSWLPSGAYHFDRAGNYLSQIVSYASRREWIPAAE